MNSAPGLTSDIIAVSSAAEIPNITDAERIVINGVVTPQNVVDFLKAGAYDLVNTHHNASSAESRQIVLLLRKAGIPVVDSQHGRIHYSFRSICRNAVGMFLSSGVTFNSFCTEKALTLVERSLFWRKPTQVIHLGVNAAVIGRYRAKSNGAVRRISCAARLVSRKNHATLLEAVSYLKSTGVMLDIIGAGRLQPFLLAEAQRLGIADQVRFHGFLRNREEVYNTLAATDLFVLPSLGEGFCMAVAEAMAIGLPVITSDIETFREVVGDSGVFVPPLDARALAERILYFINSPQSAREVGSRNRDRALSLFSITRTVEEYRRFYERVLSQSRQRVVGTRRGVTGEGSGVHTA
jgi:glycosyltransferase involved in cell wall biosynthesis